MRSTIAGILIRSSCQIHHVIDDFAVRNKRRISSILLPKMNSGSDVGQNNDDSRPKVIIIGAGFAGLGLAYSLLPYSDRIDFEILEGRDRIGGRVHPYDLDEHTKVELGGQWVHEACEENPVRQLLEQFHIPFADDNSNDESALFDEDGNEIFKGSVKYVSRKFKTAMDAYELDEVGKEVSLQDIVDENLEVPAADENLDRILNWLKHTRASYEGGKLDELSASLWDMYEMIYGPNEYPEGTYNSILQVLAAEIGMERIRLNCDVQRIQYAPKQESIFSCDSKVTVTYKQGKEDILKNINGNVCVCTVPLGVLKQGSISFVPSLPKSKQVAIDAIGMGMLDKIILKFDHCFWGDLEYFSVTNNSNPALVTSFMDYSHVGAPVLMRWLAGDVAIRNDGLNENEAVDESMAALRLVFGSDKVPDPLATKVTRWNLDPFAYGAYSFAKIHSTEEMYDDLSAPLGNLYFGGEHTNKTCYACVHGAWDSGVRVSNQLSSCLPKS